MFLALFKNGSISFGDKLCVMWGLRVRQYCTFILQGICQVSAQDDETILSAGDTRGPQKDAKKHFQF